METTICARRESVKRKWYVIDAKGLNLGRLSSGIAMVLRGKHKPCFTPHVDTGDNVIVINARLISVHEKKLSQKFYHRYSGYQGGLRSIALKNMFEKHPERIIFEAIKGMLPRGPLGRDMIKKLYVYADGIHKHVAQQPKQIEFINDRIVIENDINICTAN